VSHTTAPQGAASHKPTAATRSITAKNNRRHLIGRRIGIDIRTEAARRCRK